MTKTKNNKQTSTVRMTIQPIVSAQVANREFAKSIATDDTNDDTLEKFLIIIQNLSENSRSFTILDVLYACQTWELDTLKIKDYFNKWKNEMLRLNRISETLGCYDHEVYCFN